MALDIIGAGYGRTGTLSLKNALELLGFGPCYHMLEVHQHADHVPMWRAAGRGEAVDWGALFKDYRSTVDWPSCNFWREQLHAFPDAKVILSVRDAQSWYDSVMNTIWKVSEMMRAAATEPAARAQSDMVFEIIWDGTFQRRMEDRAHVIATYERHNQAVIDALPADRLLVYRTGDGWPPLCEFLGVPVPETPYPQVNSTEDFQRMVGMRND